MTQPRRILAGATYAVSRRTLRRHHLLRPDPATNNLFIYALAVCAKRFEIRVHAVCLMSTHYHLVVTDVCGLLPLFLAHFHRMVALAIKVARKWEGPVWDHESTSAVRLETREAIVDKIAYCVANPVAAGLVYFARDWPGVSAHAVEFVRDPLTARRPVEYFDPKNPIWPNVAALELSVAPHYSADEVGIFDEHVAQAVDAHERAARTTMKRNGWKCRGATWVANTSPYDRTTSFEPLRSLNPTFAVGGLRGAYERAARALQEFRRAYRDALEAWRKGLRSVLFPAGTWWMSRCHSAAVAGA